MKLVYLSPVPLNSFEQRPHFMVRELLRGGVDSALWLEPYPTRLPRLSDLRRPSESALASLGTQLPVRAIRPKALPIEPLTFGQRINYLIFFRTLLEDVSAWLGSDSFILAIGKPSPLAIALLDRCAADKRCVGTVYDRMDRFASFHSGLSARAMQGWEDEILRKVDRVQVASSSLLAEVKPGCAGAALCLNGFDEKAIAAALAEPSTSGPEALGYVGTIGGWFDWEWVIRLAEQLDAERSTLRVRLIGPCFRPPPRTLPSRVALEPPLPHSHALSAMRDFQIGLIPFKVGPLTDGVDPIKYYEYRALGLPVVGTSFGELRRKTADPGLLLADQSHALAAVHSALARSRDQAPISLPGCTWQSRFAPLVDWARGRQGP
jgi:hypothetical protein